jgi:hypothetical protein
MVPEDKPRTPIVLSLYEAGQLLRYAYARTVASVQGLTFADKRVILLEAHHPRFCKRKLYVAASRCTDPDLFHIATPEIEREMVEIAAVNLEGAKMPDDDKWVTQPPAKRAAPKAEPRAAKRQKK